MSPALVKAAIDFTSVQLSGSTMTGPLILNGDPTQNLGAATKQYVDTAVGGTIKTVYNGNTANGTINNFSINVSNAKFLIMSFYISNPSNSINIYIYDSNNTQVVGMTFGVNVNYSNVLFAKTYDGKFTSSRSYNRSDSHLGSAPAVFNTAFKVMYNLGTAYLTAYAMF